MLTSFFARLLQILIGYTPHFLLFFWDYFIYFITYHLLHYRKKVVQKNLKLAFPDKSKNYYKKIEKQFYHYFARLIIDIAINGTTNKTKRLKYLKFENINEIKKCLSEGKNVMIALGHLSAWTTQIILSEVLEVPVYMVYKPLSNKYIDNWLRNNLHSPNTIFIDNRSAARHILKVSKQGTPSVFLMVADQSPATDTGVHWVDFFGINTPFHRGIEFLATKFNMPVFFADILYIKPFEYTTKYHLIYNGEEKVESKTITQRFANVLEKAICEHPGDYLWSHKRWKKVIKY